jgi:hypothetical protein
MRLVPESPGSQPTVAVLPAIVAMGVVGAPGGDAAHGVCTVPSDSVCQGNPLVPINFDTSTLPTIPLTCAVEVYCHRSAIGACDVP